MAEKKKIGGKGKLRGEDGVKFSKENQPTPQAKSDGWKRRSMFKKLLEMSISGDTTALQGLRESISDLTGIPESEVAKMDFGQALLSRQLEKAITEGDTNAAFRLLEFIYGPAKQSIEVTGQGGKPLVPPIIQIIQPKKKEG